MSGQRHRLLGLPFFFALLALVAASAQGGRGPSPPETLERDKPVVRHVWPKGLPMVFLGEAGEAINLSVTSKTTGGGFDPFVRLFDPAGEEEAFDDDSGGNGNCLLQDHVLKASGRYRILIGAEDNKEGEVEVLLQDGSVAAPEGTGEPSSPGRR